MANHDTCVTGRCAIAAATSGGGKSACQTPAGTQRRPAGGRPASTASADWPGQRRHTAHSSPDIYRDKRRPPSSLAPLPLHDVVFTIDWRETFPRLHQNQAIHAIGHVHPHRGCGAVIDIQPWIEGGKRELRAVARRGKRRSRAAPRASDGVQIDIMWHFAIGVIVQMQFHHIPLFDTDEFPRHAAAKGPEEV